MKKHIPYFTTILIALFLVFIGNSIFSTELDFMPDDSQVARAVVQTIIARTDQDEDTNDYEFDWFSDMGTEVTFNARIRNGEHRGEIVEVTQFLMEDSRFPMSEVEEGDSILLISYDNENWDFMEYDRTNGLIFLVILFMLGLLIFGRKKGFNTILSLGFTCAAIFAVFIPAILSGRNIYLMAILVCAYTILTTLMLIYGFNKRSGQKELKVI